VLLYQSITGSTAVLGWRFVVVTGDSMEPTICAGALLLARETPFHRLEEGDVIVFEAGGKLATRRVVALEYGAAITKGDAALLPDALPVTPEMYRCKVRKVYNGFAWITKALTS
jgi:signal peptidase I